MDDSEEVQVASWRESLGIVDILSQQRAERTVVKHALCLYSVFSDAKGLSICPAALHLFPRHVNLPTLETFLPHSYQMLVKT